MKVYLAISQVAAKLVPGFPDYEATPDGQIWSRRSTKYLKPLVVPNGYRHVVLCNGSGKHRLAVHRLIAKTFLGEPPKGAVINHKNCIRSDNAASNLEWCSQSHNVQHAYDNGRRTINAAHRGRASKLGRSKRKLSLAQVAEIKLGFSGRRGDVTRLAQKYGIDRKGIKAIVSGLAYTEEA
jgi:hypothetical protein